MYKYKVKISCRRTSLEQFRTELKNQLKWAKLHMDKRRRNESAERIIEERILQIRDKATSCTYQMSLTPTHIGYNDTLCDCTAKIADLTALLDEMKSQIAYINTIDDKQMREILYLRFIDCLSWKDIAWKVYDYRCDEDYVRITSNRFLSSSG